MTVAMGLVFIAMAHQGDVLPAPECLQQSQRKLLPMILDSPILSVEAGAFFQFAPVAATKFRPRDTLLTGSIHESFAGCQIWHPNVIAIT